MSFAGSLAAGDNSIQLYRSGDMIFDARLFHTGLLVEYETTAVLADVRSFGVSQAYGLMPPVESHQRIVFSPHGSYAMLLSYTGAGDYYYTEWAEILTLMNGKFLKTFQNPGFNDAIISDDGIVVGIFRNINIAEQSKLLFFEKTGTLLQEVSLPIITEVKSDLGIIGVNSGVRGLVFYNNDGRELLNLGTCQVFDFAGFAPFKDRPMEGENPGMPADYYHLNCVYSNGKTIGYFNAKNPDKRWEKSFGEEIIRHLDLHSSSGNFIAASKHVLYYINGVTGELIWSHEVKAPVSITSISINRASGVDIYIAYGWEIDEGRSVGPMERHNKGGYTVVLREYGRSQFKTLLKEDLKYSNWNIFTPKVKFTYQGLLIQTMDEVRILKMGRAQ